MIKEFYWESLPWFRARALQLKILWLRTLSQFSRRSLLDSSGPVVSITTYGQRIATVHITIESIGRGKQRPSRMILWIDNAELLNKLPRSLIRQKNRGLELLMSENLGPHTKYMPFIEMATNFALPLVTADDDVVYPDTWMADLYAAHRATPDQIVCHRARTIQLNGCSLAPYRNWQASSTEKPTTRNLALGVCGVLYPQRMQQTLKEAGRGFQKTCPKNDDLWLHVQALRAGILVRQIRAKAGDFPTLPNTQDQALFKSNLLGGQNDIQISATYCTEDINKIAAGE